MKKPSKKLKVFVNDHVNKYIRLIGFPHYAGEIRYMEDDEEGNDNRIAGKVAGKAIVQHRYLTVDFEFYPVFDRMFEDGKIEECKDVIAHEVAHIATQQLFDLTLSVYKSESETHDAWEQTTQRIAKLMRSIHKLETKK